MQESVSTGPEITCLKVKVDGCNLAGTELLHCVVSGYAWEMPMSFHGENRIPGNLDDGDGVVRVLCYPAALDVQDEQGDTTALGNLSGRCWRHWIH